MPGFISEVEFTSAIEAVFTGFIEAKQIPEENRQEYISSSIAKFSYLEHKLFLQFGEKFQEIERKFNLSIRTEEFRLEKMREIYEHLFSLYGDQAFFADVCLFQVLGLDVTEEGSSYLAAFDELSSLKTEIFELALERLTVISDENTNN